MRACSNERILGAHVARRRSAKHCAAWTIALAFAATVAQAQAPSNAYDYTRTDAYTYDSTTGFVLTHTVEPSTGSLCRLSTFGYDAYGNASSVSTAQCTNSATVTVPRSALFATHLTTTNFTAPATQSITVSGSATSVSYPSGLAPTQVTNALAQSETRQIDPRFGTMLALTGPNTLTTQWTVDDFGRVVRETAPDNTSIVSYYCVIAGRGLDTSANSTGCVTPLLGETPADAVSSVQMEPHDANDAKSGTFERSYSDRLGRVIRIATQGFDGAGQTAGYGGAIVVQDIVYNAFGAVAFTSQPYFLGTQSSTTGGHNDVGAVAMSYDVLGRRVTVSTADMEGYAGGVNFGPYGTQKAAQTAYAYAGMATTITNDKAQTRVEERNAIGEIVRITDSTGAQLAHQTDAFGNLVATKDALQNTIAIAFDVRGNRLSINDPDGGVTLDCYDALGELVAYQYAKMRGAAVPGSCPSAPNNGQTAAATVSGWITQAYDKLGRATQRIEPEFTSTWSYDAYADSTACNKGVGKLCQAVTSAGINRKIVYDALGRPSNTLLATGTGPSFASAVAYDAPTGRVASVTYPTGLQVGYTYTALGYPEKLLLNTPASLTPLQAPKGGVSSGGTVPLASGALLWQAQAVNAWGVMEKQSYGNGVVTTNTFEAATGRTTDLTAGAGSATNVLNHHYVWDSLDNLQNRNDANGDGSGAVTESFDYGDGLNRLTGYTVAGPGIPGLSRTVELQYNALGMVLYKTNVGNYVYGAQGPGAVQPHALQSVVGAAGTTTNGYDANGNLTTASAGKYRSLTYTSFNLPDGQTGLAGPSGGPKYTWNYDDAHARIKEVKVSGGATRTTWYLHPDNAGGLGFESEINSTGTPALNDNRHFLTAGGQVVGVLVSPGNVPAPVGTAPPVPASPFLLEKVEYWHQDHLGSIVATTDHLGNVTARYAYDPFGKRRPSNGTYDANGQLVVDWSSTTNAGTARGFTGHEELDDVGLVHMNGRLFDPTLGLFLQADPFVVHPHDLQSFNRYGYCLNNPLTCKDPSGFDDEIVDFSGVPVADSPNDPQTSTGPGDLAKEIGADYCSPDGTYCRVTVWGKPITDPDGKGDGGGPGKGDGKGDGDGDDNGNSGDSGGSGDGSGLGGFGGPGGTGGRNGTGAGGGSGGGGSNHSGNGSGAGTGGTGSANSPGGAGSQTGGTAGAGSPGSGSGSKYVAPGVTSASGGHNSSGSISNVIHVGLTAVSFCPSVCGAAFSGLDGVLSLAEGDRAGAAISFGAAAVGIFSDAGAAKAAALTIRNIGSTGKVGEDALKLLGGISQKGS